jgi:hypothetical protein
MKIWKYPSSAALLINCCWSLLNHRLSLNHIPPSWSEHAHSSIYNQMAYVIAKNDFDGLHQLIVRFFLCPQLIWILFVFLRVHCIAPRWSTFQGVSRRVDVISTRDFANSINVLESNLIFQRSCLFKSNCWNEIREMLVLEKIFWKSSFFDQRFNIHYSM